ncbi:hypothetical protein [Aurantibacter aestuarii]|uniref:Uncharacterized protein n=1 Tax=Aurantibacter aestuarii TaxID=1266046 RepID=A0A2T1N9Q1_9FLAO|nr:hypothetical protein [Aurantibacter aestuarii]PSG88588.1 hypothetical protein C7H52_09855 [Aurantibacter aestuarii]
MNFIFYYLAIFIGLCLLLNDSFFGLVYFKIIGLILVMFSVYKLQSKIPCKTDETKVLNSIEEDENI